MWESIGSILGLAAFIAIIWVIDHGVDETATAIGKAVRAFRDAARF
jgi:hypothetical protein